jgi:hypothetical protein
MRKLAPFGAAIVLAALVVAVIRATDASEGAAYGLIGFAAGVLLVVGVQFAFSGSFKDVRVVKPGEPTPIAENGHHDESLPDRELVPLAGTQPLDKSSGDPDGPATITARGTRVVRVETVKVLPEALGVRHEKPA